MVKIVQKQHLIPVRDLNGAVVRWQLQTIEYDEDITIPPARTKPKNFHPPAPWMIDYRVISTP